MTPMEESTESPYTNLEWGDNPRRPILLLNCRGERRELDILKSLRENPLNIKHPLIVEAVARYTRGVMGNAYAGRGVKLPPAEKAEKCLSRIYEVHQESARKHGRFNQPLEAMERRREGLRFFDWLARLLRSKEGKELPYLKGGRAEVESRLVEQLTADGEPTWGLSMPRVAAFIAEAELPGKKTAESLYHHFLAYEVRPERRKSVGAIRQAASEMNRRAKKVTASEDSQRYLHPYHSTLPVDYGSPDPDPMHGLAFKDITTAS